MIMLLEVNKLINLMVVTVVYTLNRSSLSAVDKWCMEVSGCDRRVPEVWGQSPRSSDARARKAVEIPDEPSKEDDLEKQDA